MLGTEHFCSWNLGFESLHNYNIKVALMGELVDPLGLSPSSYCGVWVRVPLGVQNCLIIKSIPIISLIGNFTRVIVK